MKYISFIVISSLLCATSSFDMKYSLQKHKWNHHIPSLIASGNIDKHRTIIYYMSEKKQPLNSTDLKGGVTLSDSYILSANFKIGYTESETCLFSLDRKGKQKLALCFEPAGADAVTITLDSANIPDGKLKFEHKIIKDEWTELLLFVNKKGVTQMINCKVTEEKQFNANISGLIRLTDDMDLSLASGYKVNLYVREMDLYSPVDVTTVMTLCPNEDTGGKGDFGVVGTGLIGAKGEQGERGPKGERGDSGIAGPSGLPGTGIKGERGIAGQKGEQGEPGLPAPAAPSCAATGVSSAASAELEAFKSMLSDIKSMFNTFVQEKTDQMKYFIDLSTKCNDRLTSAELNILINNNKIEALKSAILTEAQS